MHMQDQIKQLLEREYTFENKPSKPGLRDNVIHITKIDGQTQPYRITFNHKTQAYTLSQAWQERTYIKPKWYAKKKSAGLFELFEYIVKAHNKACKHMTAWRTINW